MVEILEASLNWGTFPLPLTLGVHFTTKIVVIYPIWETFLEQCVFCRPAEKGVKCATAIVFISFAL